ncbi:hypothetical protein TraAM80_01387 [Trypanosoma rangeli]|uniref:Methyltransferase n=1 Tax=Trypanosoma rangeli TaxID=5698 RepID=A0A3R7MSW2_TRYRA|nr:uncharacterized protein TraAM80_01387 [Trypanosoma rangeli]RNF10684.1 hypothetical protein TraAM80_01387 [Trypanosoma rangeli]|eukprot:RNF10684.1 hypothetical protein TraAM80_01387 [Trypanosoma rangeli]
MQYTTHGPHPPVSLLLFLQSASPQLTFEAFKGDCRVFGMPWYCSQAQQLCVAMLVKHPLVQKFPPRTANIRAFLKCYITQLELLQATPLATEALNEDLIDSQLMEAYVDFSVTSPSDFQTSMCYKTFYSPCTPKTFLPVRLAAGQFTNVGLALWPASFVLVQLLLTELSSSVPVLLPREGDLRILELGAGVGLTPLMLHQCLSYKERVKRCVLTDYQPELVENILFNLHSYIRTREPLHDSLCCSEEEDAPYVAEILDWTEHERNRESLRKWECNIILASDCIYDVDLIDSFVTTLHHALNSAEDAVAIVVQSHRHKETMKRFFDAAQAAAISVSSYRLARKSPPPSESILILSSPVCQDDSIAGFAVVPADIDADGSFMGCQAEGSCVSGWVGSFFLHSEAVVGIHVLQLR